MCRLWCYYLAVDKMPLPDALRRTYPNLIEALEEDIPSLCTILAGFEGLVFITVATLHEELPKTTFRPLMFATYLQTSWMTKGLVVMLSGLACVFLYLSVIAMVYSRMSRFRHLVAASELKSVVLADPDLIPIIERDVRIRDKRRFRLANTSMFCFNTALMLILVTGLVFAPTLLFSIGIYLVSLIWIWSLLLLRTTLRSPPAPYILNPQKPAL